MSVDSGRHTNVSREEEESPAVPRHRLRIRVLMMVEQIVVKNDYEWEALELLKRQNFGHAKRFESRFLMKTGLKQDMNNAFTAVGWENFIDIVEPGLQLLTMEFLISLAIEETGAKTKVYIRLFNKQFEMKLKDFSITLGFHKRCTLDPNELAKKHRYDRNSWWSAISNEPVSSKNSVVSIHNPTLRFLAKTLVQTFAFAACSSCSTCTP